LPRAGCRALGKAFAENQADSRQRKADNTAGATVTAPFTECQHWALGKAFFKFFLKNFFAKSCTKGSRQRNYFIFLENRCESWSRSSRQSNYFIFLKKSLPRANATALGKARKLRNQFPSFTQFPSLRSAVSQLCRAQWPWHSAKVHIIFFFVFLHFHPNKHCTYITTITNISQKSHSYHKQRHLA
jgi:hypothetical protein